jgi:hypothetical protein
VKLFVKWFLPLVIAFAITQQGCHYASIMLSAPSDLAVLGGTILGMTSVAGLISFAVTWYKEPLKRIGEALTSSTEDD